MHTCIVRAQPGTQASQLCIYSECTLRCQLFCTSSAIASKGRSAGTTTSPSSSTSSSLPIDPMLLPLLPVTHHAAGWLRAKHDGHVKVSDFSQVGIHAAGYNNAAGADAGSILVCNRQARIVKRHHAIPSSCAPITSVEKTFASQPMWMYMMAAGCKHDEVEYANQPKLLIDCT